MAVAGHHDPEDYNNMSYPEPPQGFVSGPMDLGLSPESYSSYPHSHSHSSHSRPSHHEYATTTTMGYSDANGPLYAEAGPYMYHGGGKSSPGMYPDDSDMRVPSSNLSIASASSSNMGSPLSNHGQLAPIPEWAAAPHGLGVSPGIVDQNDYFPGTEYSFTPSAIDGFSHAGFEFAAAQHSKGPGFVGELSQIPRSSRPSFFPSDSSVSFPSSSSSFPPSSPSASLANPPRAGSTPRGGCGGAGGGRGSVSSSISSSSTGTLVPLHRTSPNRASASSSTTTTTTPSASASAHLGGCNSGSTSGLGLALDTRLAQASVTSSPIPTSASSLASSSLVFASPATSTSSFSSPTPPQPAWGGSPCVDDLSLRMSLSPTPTPASSSSARPRSARMVPHFFSQSSGHFVPPLETSCWFPLSNPSLEPRFRMRPTDPIRLTADPSLIHPDVRSMAMPAYEPSYPAPNSTTGYPASPALSASPQLRTGSTSPFLHNANGTYQSFSPFQPPVDPQRRPSLVSFHSNYSGEQPYSGDESSKEKQRCPHPDCGKIFKDIKAHMLTHQTERPEKCPITTCEYHIKGFARKYDKNRHTLTHYKGTMVCGFCPGSGSAAEKSFNRADVFKRHLTAVHGVEQTPPNSRKKAAGSANGGSAASKKLTSYAPDATGKCSTCSQTFSNAQDFYEHLDDCVLRIVQQEDPAEAINARRLAEVENDRDVHNTLEKNHLPTTTMTTQMDNGEEDDDMVDDEDDEDLKACRGGIKSSATSPSKKSKGNPPNGVQKSRGLTHSRGGVALPTKTRGRKNRRDYPSSWGFDKGQMTMKKRVMAVFDGPRRLAKDDMMLSTEHEVRVKLADGKSYVTDLDVQTLKRAAGFHGATDEEKGPWISDDPTEDQLKQMLESTNSI
ncbi:hypothetical protein B0T19DRAFT_179451 [Cercophora scortea]|uniref:C2H2-type domain-containing protein n=1 Tax=Cercophora scortea TaxID=314031 RepID=A0AAE0IN39_9PEZI|nr:hypothetical protein B0T19DRAFT_179451 [Cercophora scortea]